MKVEKINKTKIQLLLENLQLGYDQMLTHFMRITLEEALFVPNGGYRCILGTLKHAAGWSHVYHSYAFEAKPKHWTQINWPYGLRDTIIKTESYLNAVIDWFKETQEKLLADLDSLNDSHVNINSKVHWGEEAPLYRIVTIMASITCTTPERSTRCFRSAAGKHGKKVMRWRTTIFQPLDTA